MELLANNLPIFTSRILHFDKSQKSVPIFQIHIAMQIARSLIVLIGEWPKNYSLSDCPAGIGVVILKSPIGKMRIFGAISNKQIDSF